MTSYLDMAKEALKQHRARTQKEGDAPVTINELNEINEIEEPAISVQPEHTGLTLEALLDRLRKGTAWLTEHHNRWPDPGAASDALFTHGLDIWDMLEKELRFRFPEYGACAVGPGGRCPDSSPVTCVACVGDLRRGDDDA